MHWIIQGVCCIQMWQAPYPFEHGSVVILDARYWILLLCPTLWTVLYGWRITSAHRSPAVLHWLFIMLHYMVCHTLCIKRGQAAHVSPFVSCYLHWCNLRFPRIQIFQPIDFVRIYQGTVGYIDIILLKYLPRITLALPSWFFWNRQLIFRIVFSLYKI